MTDSPQTRILSVQRSQLVVIDVQERLLPVIRDQRSVVKSICFLLDAAAILQVSTFVTEQYPKGLGPTVELLHNHPATVAMLEKLKFSAAEKLQEHPRFRGPQIVLAGIETHICVQQTALELFEKGFQVFVAADCVGSRNADDHQWALHRMAEVGVIITTAEAIAFEWCERAGNDSFRTLSRLVRDRDTQRSDSNSV